MPSDTLRCLACWPCVELLRQYELLRVRSHYEDLCGSFMHREYQRARRLTRGKEGIAQQKGDFSGDVAPRVRDSTSLEHRLDCFPELTPRESFNRWLMERRSVPAGHADPLIPSIQRSVSDGKTAAQGVGLRGPGDENMNGFGEVASSATYPEELTRNGKVVSKTDTGVQKNSGDESVSGEGSGEASPPECTSASAPSSFDWSSTATLEREILEDLPMKVSISSTPGTSRKYLTDYARAVGSIMLEEKQKVERVPLAALSPLVEALLVLLRGERGLTGRDSEASTGRFSEARKRGAADLLVALSSELCQQRRKVGSISPQHDVSNVTQREQKGVGASCRDTHASCCMQNRTEEILECTADFRSENLSVCRSPEAVGGSKTADRDQDVCSDNGKSSDMVFRQCINKAVAQAPFYNAVNKAVLPVSLPPDFVRKSFCTSDCSFSKDDVYYTVCLARPILKAIYGEEVRALVKNVEEVAKQAAARVAQYTACLAVEHAGEIECSPQYSEATSSKAIQVMNVHSTVQDVNTGEAVLLPKSVPISVGAYGEEVEASAETGRLVADTSTQRGNAAVGAEVRGRGHATINGGRALLLNKFAAPCHSVACADEQECLCHTLVDHPVPPSNATDGCFMVNNIRWISCRGYECFVYVGDVEMLAWDESESVRTDIFRSFRSRYSLKGYKVVQLWTRFISRKMGRKDEDSVGGDYMRAECVCSGRGWCSGEWTCSCVRRQIKRIQRSAYAGEFTVKVFCLLCRYYSVCGCRKQGKGLHSAAPCELMQVLKEQLGVDCELFASPLNVTLNTYCSLFPDIDASFGSEGSFFDPNFNIREGSYEANPPFEEVIMSRVITRIQHWLDVSAEKGSETETQRPLSFCILVPYWPAGPSQYMDTLIHSKYMRFSFVVPENQHYFLSGFQHFCPRKDVARVAVCKTLFAVLQNEAGAKKWPIRPDIVERIKATWNPGNMSWFI